MRRQLSILLALLLASLACTINAPPAALHSDQGQPTPPTTPFNTDTPAMTPQHQVTETPSNPATVTPALHITETRICAVNTQALNVRSGPGLEHPAIAWLHEGERVIVRSIPHPADWLPVQTDKLAGWVKAEFCEVRP